MSAPHLPRQAPGGCVTPADVLPPVDATLRRFTKFKRADKLLADLDVDPGNQVDVQNLLAFVRDEVAQVRRSEAPEVERRAQVEVLHDVIRALLAGLERTFR